MSKQQGNGYYAIAMGKPAFDINLMKSLKSKREDKNKITGNTPVVSPAEGFDFNWNNEEDFKEQQQRIHSKFNKKEFDKDNFNTNLLDKGFFEIGFKSKLQAANKLKHNIERKASFNENEFVMEDEEVFFDEEGDRLLGEIEIKDGHETKNNSSVHVNKLKSVASLSEKEEVLSHSSFAPVRQRFFPQTAEHRLLNSSITNEGLVNQSNSFERMINEDDTCLNTITNNNENSSLSILSPKCDNHNTQPNSKENYPSNISFPPVGESLSNKNVKSSNAGSKVVNELSIFRNLASENDKSGQTTSKVILPLLNVKTTEVMKKPEISSHVNVALVNRFYDQIPKQYKKQNTSDLATNQPLINKIELKSVGLETQNALNSKFIKKFKYSSVNPFLFRWNKRKSEYNEFKF